MIWTNDMNVVCWELYKMVGRYPVGNLRNAYVLRIAQAFGVTPDSVHKKLGNIAFHDPLASGKGLKNDQRIRAVMFWHKTDPKGYRKAVNACRRTFHLRGVI